MNAIGYIRISTKDQSTFSLAAQEEQVRNYAARHGHELLELFTDDGQSAKNFDRVEWKKLETFVKAHHSKVSFLIVPKYDRFSRNVSEALQMIELLEKRFNILIISVFEPISCRTDSPYYFQFRTQMLMNAQVERLVIIERTKSGQHQAAKQGLVINNAPYGYKNHRNEKKQPTLAMDEGRVPIIKEAFKLFLQGVGYQEIQTHLRRFFGFTMHKKGAIQRILANPVYAGLVKVPAFMDEPVHYVKGIHEAIISPDTWWSVQELMSPKPKPKTILHPDFPLRGALHCHCGKHFTAANSTGKKKKVGYYFCSTHRGVNLNASRIHEQFNDILNELSLPDNYIAYLCDETKAQMEIAVKDKAARLKEKKEELRSLLIKQDNLQEQFINKEWSRDDYHKWNTRFASERSILEKEISEMSLPIELIWQHYGASLHKLGNVKSLFEGAELHQKQSFINLVFDGKLQYSDGYYRTPYLINVFQPKAASLQQKRLLLIEQPGEKNGDYLSGSVSATKIEHLKSFLSLVASVRVA